MLESALESLHVNYAPLLLRGRLGIVRDTAAKKEIDMAISMTLEHVSSEIQENRRKN